MIPGKRVVLPLFAAFLVAACGPGEADVEVEEAPPPPPDSTPTIVLETTMGRIVMELNESAAPATVANFVRHVSQGFYNGIIFDRVRPEFMIQAGILSSDYSRRLSPAAMLMNEGDNGLSNVRGAVAMARAGDPHTAKTQFFINVDDNPQLDTSEDTWGYCVFGRVIEGMDVVDLIKDVPTRTRGTRESIPVDPIIIDTAYIAVDESEWADTTEAEEGTEGL